MDQGEVYTTLQVEIGQSRSVTVKFKVTFCAFIDDFLFMSFVKSHDQSRSFLEQCAENVDRFAKKKRIINPTQFASEFRCVLNCPNVLGVISPFDTIVLDVMCLDAQLITRIVVKPCQIDRLKLVDNNDFFGGVDDLRFHRPTSPLGECNNTIVADLCLPSNTI
jgi:hypothetical protein